MSLWLEQIAQEGCGISPSPEIFNNCLDAIQDGPACAGRLDQMTPCGPLQPNPNPSCDPMNFCNCFWSIFLLDVWLITARMLLWTQRSFCRCHHSRSCLAVLPKLKKVQEMGQGWEERVTIGRGEDWERKSLEETWRPEHCYFFWNYHQMKNGRATSSNGWWTQPPLLTWRGQPGQSSFAALLEFC